MTNSLQNISDFLKDNSTEITVDESNFYIVNKTILKEQLNGKGIKFQEESVRCKLLLQSINKNIIPYKNLKYFEPEYLKSEFIILDCNGDYYHFKSSQEPLLNLDAKINFKNRCNNLITYFKLLDTVTDPSFADHHNQANQEIVLFSSVYGIFNIKYDFIVIPPDENDYTNDVLNLINNLNIIELQQYLKNTFFKSSNGLSILLNDIFTNAKEIVTSAKRDYELVSKKFDFSKFKDSLYKEKEKYFNDIRDIISKIFSQAIGIPLSITATLFATYKIPDNSVVLFLILLCFLIYTIFYVSIQIIYKTDLKEIEVDFKRDFDIIKSNSGLDDQTVSFQRIKIERKLKISFIIINLLIITVILLALILSLYIFIQIYKNELNYIFPIIISLFVTSSKFLFIY